MYPQIKQQLRMSCQVDDSNSKLLFFIVSEWEIVLPLQMVTATALVYLIKERMVWCPVQNNNRSALLTNANKAVFTLRSVNRTKRCVCVL